MQFWKKFECFNSCAPVPFRKEYKNCVYCGLLLCCLDGKDQCLNKTKYKHLSNMHRARKKRKRRKDSNVYELFEDGINNNYLGMPI